MSETTDDVRCWFCDALLDGPSVEREGYLVPRRTVEGGPLWLIRCPHCENENGAERNRAGEFLLVPCVRAGLAGRIAAFFDPSRTRLRARARVWWRRNRKRRRAFHATPPRPRAEAEPSPDVPRDGPRPEERPEERDVPRPEPEREPDARPPGGEPPPPLDDPAARVLENYRTLEVPLTASREEISAAFRRLSQRCHPDKVAHLDEEFQELAVRKFRRILEAYEAIMDAFD